MASVIIFQKSDALLGNRKKQKKRGWERWGVRASEAKGGRINIIFKLHIEVYIKNRDFFVKLYT